MSAALKVGPREASATGLGLRLFLGVSLLLVAALLAAGQWILNVRGWTTPASPVPPWVDRLGSLLPAATAFPAHANVAFAAFALAGLLFARPRGLSRFAGGALRADARAAVSRGLARARADPLGSLWSSSSSSPRGAFCNKRGAERMSPRSPSSSRQGRFSWRPCWWTARGRSRCRRFGSLLPRLAYPSGILALLMALAAGHARRPAVLAISGGMAAVLLAVALVAASSRGGRRPRGARLDAVSLRRELSVVQLRHGFLGVGVPRR